MIFQSFIDNEIYGNKSNAIRNYRAGSLFKLILPFFSIYC
jgi:hypothetical protein